MKKMNLLIILALLVFVTVSNAEYSYNEKRGEKLFIEQCSKCHRKDGSGIKMVYPPVKKADYIAKQDNVELIRGMIYGRSGKIVVNGYPYNGVMTTEIDKSLTDYDILDILNYVLNKLNNLNRFAQPKDVKDARKAGKLPVHK